MATAVGDRIVKRILSTGARLPPETARWRRETRWFRRIGLHPSPHGGITHRVAPVDQLLLNNCIKTLQSGLRLRQRERLLEWTRQRVGAGRLEPALSDEYQDKAAGLARKSKIARVRLVAIWSGERLKEETEAARGQLASDEGVISPLVTCDPQVFTAAAGT